MASAGARRVTPRRKYCLSEVGGSPGGPIRHRNRAWSSRPSEGRSRAGTPTGRTAGGATQPAKLEGERVAAVPSNIIRRPEAGEEAEEEPGPRGEGPRGSDRRSRETGRPLGVKLALGGNGQRVSGRLRARD